MFGSKTGKTWAIQRGPSSIRNHCLESGIAFQEGVEGQTLSASRINLSFDRVTSVIPQEGMRLGKGTTRDTAHDVITHQGSVCKKG
jgi:hypothetical protein